MIRWRYSLTESLRAFRVLQQRADQLQLELERTKKDLSLTKQELESNRVLGDETDVVSETNIMTSFSFEPTSSALVPATPDPRRQNGRSPRAEVTKSHRRGR